jgi:hypothetical protein
VASKPAEIKIKADTLADLKQAINLLAAHEVLVGFPEATTKRDKTADETGEITNASLGYIHDTGMPEQNIPARPFMQPGMESAADAAANLLGRMAKRVLVSKSSADVDAGFHRVGLTVQAALKRKINEGIPPPLADATIEARARRGRKGAKLEIKRRAAGEAPSTQFAKPLIDTSQLRNAINYVIRLRSKRGA